MFRMRWAVGRERGGLEEEAEERQRWIDKENKRIMDSVNGNTSGELRGCHIPIISELKWCWTPCLMVVGRYDKQPPHLWRTYSQQRQSNCDLASLWLAELDLGDHSGFYSTVMIELTTTMIFQVGCSFSLIALMK